MSIMERYGQDLLAKADIGVNGTRPFDIQVHDPRFFRRAMFNGSLGLAEAYIDGDWDCDQLDEFIYRILAARLDQHVLSVSRATLLVLSSLVNMQTTLRSRIVGERHYDLGNDLYRAMLDSRMIYSCGYDWKNATTLDEAQEAKLDLICRKLGLKQDDRVLDIGCGWGGFLKFAAKKYGITGIGITISKEQAALAREACKGLDVEIRLEDYRETTGQFDHIVSIGMFEHVGPKNYSVFFKKACSLLKDEGLLLLHTIGGSGRMDPFITKYIFPNGVLPRLDQVAHASRKWFVLEDMHNFGADYDMTLCAWYENFDRAWPDLKTMYNDRFYRMWRFYLLSCAGAFRARRTQLWQFVFSKHGVPGGYMSVR